MNNHSQNDLEQFKTLRATILAERDQYMTRINEINEYLAAIGKPKKSKIEVTKLSA